MKGRYTIRVPSELRANLEALSTRTGQPLSEIAREAIRRYVAGEELRAVREELRRTTGAADRFTEEDILREVL